MSAPKPAPQRPDGACVVEVCAAPVGLQFRITSRQRVLSWERVGDAVLPKVATGVVAKEAFIPSRAGLAMVEYRDEQGTRLFMCPLVPDAPPLRERGLRALVKRAAAGAFERGLASEGSTAADGWNAEQIARFVRGRQR